MAIHMWGRTFSNGVAEKAVRHWEDYFATLRHAFELRMGQSIDISHPIMTWLVQHASYLLSRYRLRPGGRSGMGRIHGRELREQICEFGERVLFY